MLLMLRWEIMIRFGFFFPQILQCSANCITSVVIYILVEAPISESNIINPASDRVIMRWDEERDIDIQLKSNIINIDRT